METSSAAMHHSSARKNRRTRDTALPVISIGSVKCAGSSTLALTLASASASAGLPVMLIDAAADPDLSNWAVRSGRPGGIEVVRCDKLVQMAALAQEGSERRAVVIIDAGTRLEMLRAAARVADTVLVPVRFSPLSALAAAATAQFLLKETASRGKRQAFVATAITQIPSRIARAVEAQIQTGPTERLPCGLVQRAAYEAPFMFGGTIFNMEESLAPGLATARREATVLAGELDILKSPGSKLASRVAETVLADRRRAA